MRIKKRDGRVVDFDKQKIAEAVTKAAKACGWGEIDAKAAGKRIAVSVESSLRNELKSDVEIEHIQDVVEETLMRKESLSPIAKAYILYREKRSNIRASKSQILQRIKDVTFTESKDSNDQRENANIDADSPMGTMLKYGGIVSKEYALNDLVSKEFSEAHRDGLIHIHDLDFYALTTTCTQIDLTKLFKDGFFTGHGYLREPNSIASYFALAAIAIQSNQNNQHKPNRLNCAA